MNKSISVSILMLVMIGAGIAIGRWLLPEPDMAESPAEIRRVLYWQAPMDPAFRRDKPGKSPMGMDLVPIYADEMLPDEPGAIRIDPRIVNNMGVRSETSQLGVLSRLVNTVGYVSYDEDTVHHIHTRVDGWIEKLAVKTAGDPVENGQVLFELYSPTLVNAQQEYLAALRGSSAALKQASRERLIALGVTSGEIERLNRERTAKQRQSIYATTQGVVVELGVRHGMHVTPATQVMSIADLDHVWVIAEVFERQAAWVKAGQRAEVEIDYLPGQRWQGTVDYVYPELDSATRTLKVRIRFDNQSRILRPNMFTRVTIFGLETAEVVHIPREALIRGGTTDRVVLDLGSGNFRVQVVQIGIESADRIEIRNGLSAGDLVVTSGQFLLDSESNLDTALARMGELRDTAEIMEQPMDMQHESMQSDGKAMEKME